MKNYFPIKKTSLELVTKQTFRTYNYERVCFKFLEKKRGLVI
jgi:hypothetical protein